jgi:hypothetical protein
VYPPSIEFWHNKTLAFTPNTNSDVNATVQSIATKIGWSTLCFPTSDELELYYLRNPGHIDAALEFDTLFSLSGTQATISLRVNESFVDINTKVTDPVTGNVCSPEGCSPSLLVQSALQIVLGGLDIDYVYSTVMPVKTGEAPLDINVTLIFVSVFSGMYAIILLAQTMMRMIMVDKYGEKEEHDTNATTGNYEALRVSGLLPEAFWVSKFLRLSIYGLAFSFEMIIGQIITGKNASTNSSGAIATTFLIYWIVYLGLMGQICLIASIPVISNPYSAVGKLIPSLLIIIGNAGLTVLWFLTDFSSSSPFLAVVVSLFSPIPLASNYLINVELSLIQSTGGSPIVIPTSIFSNIFVVLIFSCITISLYLYLAILFEYAFFGGGGLTSCLSVCWRKIFCCFSRRSKTSNLEESQLLQDSHTVAIQNVTKVFSESCSISKNGSKLVLDRVSLTFNEGEVSSLLGHNGAGNARNM